MSPRATLHPLPERFDAWIIAVIVVATRIPFLARTLFEYDSVNYAIALFRYDIDQDTPHRPGYVLHIGVGHVLGCLLGDVSLGYTVFSVALTACAAIFVYWTIRRLSGRFAALAGTAMFAFNPFVWFYSCVPTVYAHEAFFTAVVLLIGVRYIGDPARERMRARLPLLLAGTLGIAGAARQSLLMTLLPAACWMVWQMRPPRTIVVRAAVTYLALTSVWVGILLALAGGPITFFTAPHAAHIVRVNSVFLDGTLARHFDQLAKFGFYLFAGTLPVTSLLGWLIVRRPRETMARVRRGLVSPIGRLFVVSAVPGLLFFTLVFFAKPGYLIGIYVLSVVAGTVLASRSAAPGERSVLLPWSLGWSILSIVVFACPLPGVGVGDIQHVYAAGSVAGSTGERYATFAQKAWSVPRKLFLFASAAGIRTVDEENLNMLDALRGLPSAERDQVFIGDRWSHWCMFYRPGSTTFFLDLVGEFGGQHFVAENYHKVPLRDSVILLPEHARDVVLQLWHNHPAMSRIREQVHLERLPLPEDVDLYRIVDTHFRMTIGSVTFVR